MENTKIEWTHHTFNPWIGCTKVSPGCLHCYAETLMDTRYGRVKWGKGARPMEREWVEHLCDQCDDRTAFHFKQWGGVNKKLAGRELNGKIHNNFPNI
jgi:protein gp37